MLQPTAPAGWYDDPGVPSQLRYWDSLRWTERTKPATSMSGSGVDQQSSIHVARLKLPRHTGTRLLFAFAGWVGIYFACSVVSALFVSTGTAESNPSMLVFGLLMLAIYSGLAKKVSYRSFDCLMLLVPFYGLYWSFKIMWRVVFLPYRDWAPRSNEAASWVEVGGRDGNPRQHFLVQPDLPHQAHRRAT